MAMRSPQVLAATAVLAGCASNSFLKVEPNPAEALTGFGYVDFYYRGETPIPCDWQVYQNTSAQSLFGGPYTIRARVDTHVYLAEMVASAHQIVRVESLPGLQDFEVQCGYKQNRSSRVKVAVVEGLVTPVQVTIFVVNVPPSVSDTGTKFIGRSGISYVVPNVSWGETLKFPSAEPEPPVAYKKKGDMPYAQK